LAPRLRTSDARQRVVAAGLVALALLAIGEQAPAAFPVHVSIEAHAANLQVSVDGQVHGLSSALGGGWQAVALEQPGPLQREYQVDGSDTTATNDRRPDVIRPLLGSPLYRIDAFLRDEASYSRWANLRITDFGTGQLLSGGDAFPLPSTGQLSVFGGPLPEDFRLDVELRRPEAPARVWLEAGPDRREGLELDRDRRNARWLIQRGAGTDALPRWFFPEQPAPFAAELLWLLGRSAVAAYALLLAALALGRLTHLRGSKFSLREEKFSSGTRSFPSGEKVPDGGGPANERGADTTWPLAAIGAATLGCWLVAAALASVREFQQLPHILDAVSYTFQAGLFSAGQLSLPAPPQVDAFKGPFEVLWQGRLFSQYPPGAPTVYAVGKAISLEWLVGPLACAALIGATAWTARTLFGTACGLAVLALGSISPFVLFQAGSYLSHPVAAGLLAFALASFVAGECGGSARWYAVCGTLLGAAFMAREAASVLFALPLGVWLIVTRRYAPLSWVVAFGLPFVFAYLIYNLRETGNPLVLPRMIFDASDHFGFGDGIGFHTRHTLAAGLANTDELLTLLQFDLFGWPPLFGLGLLSLPFVLGRARTWDYLALGGFLVFVVAYVGYFYHGIALGPRYYFEAMPWLLLLAARGASTLASAARGWLAPIVLLGALSLNTFLFYLPAELDRRQDMSGLPGAPPLVLDFVQTTLFGPKVVGLPQQSLIVTSDWWIYNSTLAALNCPQLPNCPVTFALASTPDAIASLRAQYPERTLLRAQRDGDRLTVVP
jgi:hypothetical protein